MNRLDFLKNIIYNERRLIERKIALEQADALDKDDKYGAFADWLTKTGTTYQDLLEEIGGANY